VVLQLDAVRPVVVVGDTFYVGHLWVVVARNAGGEFVAFNITSLRPGIDTTCVLEPTDHPSVDHKSVIYYARGMLITSDMQEQLDDERQRFMPGAQASAALIKKIQQGALESLQTPRNLKAIIAAFLGPTKDPK